MTPFKPLVGMGFPPYTVEERQLVGFYREIESAWEKRSAFLIMSSLAWGRLTDSLNEKPWEKVQRALFPKTPKDKTHKQGRAFALRMLREMEDACDSEVHTADREYRAKGKYQDNIAYTYALQAMTEGKPFQEGFFSILTECCSNVAEGSSMMVGELVRLERQGKLEPAPGELDAEGGDA